MPRDWGKPFQGGHTTSHQILPGPCEAHSKDDPSQFEVWATKLTNFKQTGTRSTLDIIRAQDKATVLARRQALSAQTPGQQHMLHNVLFGW